MRMDGENFSRGGNQAAVRLFSSWIEREFVKGRRFAAEVGVPEHVIVDTGHPNGRRMRDDAGFNDAHSATRAANRNWAALLGP